MTELRLLVIDAIVTSLVVHGEVPPDPQKLPVLATITFAKFTWSATVKLAKEMPANVAVLDAVYEPNWLEPF